MALECFHRQPEGRQLLSELIVEFPRDSPTLLLLGEDDAREQLHALLLHTMTLGDLNAKRLVRCQ